jgi:hypothetical protein
MTLTIFFHIKLSFRLINVKNDGNKVNNRLKTLAKSNLIAIFAEILQSQACNDIKNRI